MTCEIRLTRGLSALVDDQDFPELSKFRWHATQSGRTYYATRAIRTGLRSQNRYQTYSMHRVLMSAPDGMVVDHINRNGLDNRRANLRVATQKQNCRNRSKDSVPTTSVYKGVSWKESTSKWCAQITVDSRCHYIGVFSQEIDAARAYDAHAVRHFGEFASVNFPGTIQPQSVEVTPGVELTERSALRIATFCAAQLNEELKRWKAIRFQLAAGNRLDQELLLTLRDAVLSGEHSDLLSVAEQSAVATRGGK